MFDYFKQAWNLLDSSVYDTITNICTYPLKLFWATGGPGANAMLGAFAFEEFFKFFWSHKIKTEAEKQVRDIAMTRSDERKKQAQECGCATGCSLLTIVPIWLTTVFNLASPPVLWFFINTIGASLNIGVFGLGMIASM